MNHFKNTIKAILIICYLAITIFWGACASLGLFLAEIMMDGTYYSLVFIVIWGIIFLLLLPNSKRWLNFLGTYFESV